MTSSLLPIAAIVTRGSGEANRLIAEFAARQKMAGYRVRGLLQELDACDERGCQFVLVDIESGRRYPISQDLGAGSTSCSLDPGLLAEASGVMRRIAEEGADLAIFNRFGTREAEGGGMADEMLALMSRGLPVLTVVPQKHLDDWRHFTGGLASELPADAVALDAWFADCQGKPMPD